MTILRECRLGDIATISWGDTTKTKASYTAAGYVAYSASGPDGFMEHFDHDGPGIVLSAIGAQCGKTWFATGKWSCIKNTIFLKAKPGLVDPRYLYFLTSDRQLWPTRGAAQPFISQTDARSIVVQIHPLEGQRRIASILSAYDDLIENNTRRIAILEEMARRIYEEWFVRFRFPGHEGVRMAESELGPVPEGWQVRSVTDVARVHRGRSYKSSELAESGGLPFVNLKCMERDGGFRSSGLKRYTGVFKDSQTVRVGSLVMAVTDMTQERRIVARVGRVSQLGEELGVISMDLVRIETLGELPEPYLYGMFRWSGFADEVKQHANGANVLHLHPARIEDYRFACPPSELADRFAAMVAPMFSLDDALERQSTNLRTTRDLLLPKLISGELDVSDLPLPEAVAA